VVARVCLDMLAHLPPGREAAWDSREPDGVLAGQEAGLW
jgi:hypothetical protein